MDGLKGKTTAPSSFTTGTPLEPSIALVTGTTSGLGQAAARLLAIKGCRQVVVTGRSLSRAQETAAGLAAETKKDVFTPLGLDLDSPSSVKSALAELVKRGQPIDFLLLNAGMVPGKKRVLTSAGVEAAQAPADRPSSTDRRVAPRQLAEPPCADCHRGRGTCPRGRTHVQLHRCGNPRNQAFPG